MLQVAVKSSYGNNLMSVVDTKKAETIQALTGKKTVSMVDIRALETLGIAIEIVNPLNLIVR
jgi:hypothetical protein